MGTPRIAVRPLALTFALALAACGDDGTTEPTCSLDPFTVGTDGHAQPLGAAAGEARAGRLVAADLPAVPSGLATWKAGDFVLANDRVAIVIEDVGDSDLYDPWGGRPVGIARVDGGRLIAPTNFGEMFLLTGRASIITEDVSVIADGAGGGPAIVRVVGTMHPLPFFASVTQGLFDDMLGIHAAIDYELAPGSNRVDVRFRYLMTSERFTDARVLHALMYTKRTPVWVPAKGFVDDIAGAPYIALVDDAATSWAYVPPMPITSGLSVSGFVGGVAPGFQIPPCTAFDRLHAQIVIGGADGLDGVVAAVAAEKGEAVRAVTGTVTSGGAPVAGAHVHAIAVDAPTYLTRTTTDAAGAFTLHVPATAPVQLDAVADASRLGTAVSQPAGAPVTIDLPAPALVRVTVRDDGDQPLPARVQILPDTGQDRPVIPAHYGEEPFPAGRLRVVFTVTGDVTIPVPPGRWRAVVSHGYEDDVFETTFTVAAGGAHRIDAILAHQVQTPGIQCADFHIHTSRSNDSGDDAIVKVASAIADGLELPVRSDHEWVADFSAEIAALGAQAWAAGFGSVELTSFEVWGHMGVFPLVPDPTKVNAGTPRWQIYPTTDRPDDVLATMTPVAVFEEVRARPEAPVVIINHPRGTGNYFDYVGFDPATGMVTDAAAWDTRFTLVEVFNDTHWRGADSGIARDWLGLLRAGRRIFAVGSSDSHAISSSPVGYPRTCLALGTDDPRALTANHVRDTLAAGHGFVSGGIYVSARVGTAAPGDTASGLGDTADVAIEIQAADWVDVDAFDVVVDGETVDTIAIAPGDAVAGTAIRWRGTVSVDVRAAGGGFVVIAAYGDRALEPVHPGRIPFGVTNPIFLQP